MIDRVLPKGSDVCVCCVVNIFLPCFKRVFLVSFIAEFGLLIERTKCTFHLEWSVQFCSVSVGP